MITVRVYDDYNSIALQAVDTDDPEVCEFSKKFRAKSIGDMKTRKLRGHLCLQLEELWNYNGHIL